MGAICTKSDEAFWRHHHSIQKYRKTFEALRVNTSDVERIFHAFKEIDLDGSNSISIDEFFNHFELKRSKFSVRCFTIFDEDGSAELDFREFGVSLWNYCTQDQLALISFAFDLYDLDNSGSIDIDELTQMLTEVYGDRVEHNTHAQNIKKKIKSYSGIMPGQIIAKAHPSLLFPSFQVQRKLQQKAIGESFWNRLADARFKSFGQDRIDINTIRTLVTSNGFIKLIQHSSDMKHAATQVMEVRKQDASKSIKKSEEMKRKHRLMEIRKKKAGRGYMTYRKLNIEDEEERAKKIQPLTKRKSAVDVKSGGGRRHHHRKKHHHFKRHHTTAYIRT